MSHSGCHSPKSAIVVRAKKREDACDRGRGAAPHLPNRRDVLRYMNVLARNVQRDSLNFDAGVLPVRCLLVAGPEVVATFMCESDAGGVAGQRDNGRFGGIDGNLGRNCDRSGTKRWVGNGL